jgi:hypothetical protein
VCGVIAVPLMTSSTNKPFSATANCINVGSPTMVHSW